MDDMSVIAYLNRGFMATKKPLDMLIAEMQDYLSSYIITASDTVYLETNNPLYTVAQNVYYTIPISIKINMSGTVRITFSIRNVYFYVDVNGVQVTYVSETSSTSTLHTVDIEVSEGDVITLRIRGQETTTSYNSVAASSIIVCGDITPLMQTNLIELI